MTFAKTVLIFCAAAITLIVGTSQTKKTETKTPLTDSSAVISLRDLQLFNEAMKKTVSFDQYTKLSPEQTLTELWNWKLRQLNVPKNDSTKKR